MGLVDEVIQWVPVLKKKFGVKRSTSTNVFKNCGKDQRWNYYGGNDRNSRNAIGTSFATMLGKFDYRPRKLSRKPFLKESLPSYKESQMGLFNNNELEDKVRLTCRRKVSKGIDLSYVKNNTYLPKRDISKVNNWVIKAHDSNKMYKSTSPNKKHYDSQSNLKDLQGSWLDGNTKKKNIGPHKNSTSSLFVLPTASAVDISRNNKRYQGHSTSNIRRL
jgi:hypothetical protein